MGIGRFHHLLIHHSCSTTSTPRSLRTAVSLPPTMPPRMLSQAQTLQRRPTSLPAARPQPVVSLASAPTAPPSRRAMRGRQGSGDPRRCSGPIRRTWCGGLACTPIRDRWRATLSGRRSPPPTIACACGSTTGIHPRMRLAQAFHSYSSPKQYPIGIFLGFTDVIAVLSNRPELRPLVRLIIDQWTSLAAAVPTGAFTFDSATGVYDIQVPFNQPLAFSIFISIFLHASLSVFVPSEHSGFVVADCLRACSWTGSVRRRPRRRCSTCRYLHELLQLLRAESSE
jgi:hypothetical protein